jgi:hypothetical protein
MLNEFKFFFAWRYKELKGIPPVGGVSCSYMCIFIDCGNYVVSKFNKEE